MVPDPADPGGPAGTGGGEDRAAAVFLQHTSGSLSINENADLDVPVHLDWIFASLARGGKVSPGEPGVCAPPIVNRPALVPAAVVTDGLTNVTDLLPTFAQLAGACSRP